MPLAEALSKLRFSDATSTKVQSQQWRLTNTSKQGQYFKTSTCEQQLLAPSLSHISVLQHVVKKVTTTNRSLPGHGVSLTACLERIDDINRIIASARCKTHTVSFYRLKPLK